jgi:hypothetical protein
MKRYYIFFTVLAVVAALAIVSNIFLRRGPVHDTKAVQDIRNLQSAVDSYYLTQSQLPNNLRQLELDGLDVATRLGDYEYIRIDSDSYELCATFQTEHRTTKNYYGTGPDGVQMADPDNHGKGRQCFGYTVIPVRDLPLKR